MDVKQDQCVGKKSLKVLDKTIIASPLKVSTVVNRQSITIYIIYKDV